MNPFNPQELIPQLSIDSVIFGYKEKELKVLVSQLNFQKKCIHTLPGGFIKQEESINEAAGRILKDRTGLTNIYLEQFKTFGLVNRTNKAVLELLKSQDLLNPESSPLGPFDIDWISKRFVSIGYYALVDINKVEPAKSDVDESADWIGIDKLPEMIMDHNGIVTEALNSLRKNLDEKLIGFNLLPETFTMRELKELYEAVYDKPFARNNFQKKILSLNVLERLEKKFTGAANKAPFLYRFINH
ncbi:MAG: 8-oxo-dGTP diphosphatase [Arcticibacterium sp.]|jgi:8-oxo-dGTP diphosphatase